MTEFDVPRLVPVDSGAVSFQRREQLAQVALEPPEGKRVLRSGVKAADVLGLEVVVLDAGAVLDDEVASSWQAGRYVFTPSQPYPWGVDFTEDQKLQMVSIYRALPYGAKARWRARQGVHATKMHRWGQRLGLPSFMQQKQDLVRPNLAEPLTQESMTFLTCSYTSLPFGQKKAFLAEHGLNRVTIHRWIHRLAEKSQLKPRQHKEVTMDHTPEDFDAVRKAVAKILAENEQLKKDLAKANRTINQQGKEIDKWEKTSDVLGKALASMPDLPGVDYDAEENPYPKSINAAMKLADKKNNTS